MGSSFNLRSTAGFNLVPRLMLSNKFDLPSSTNGISLGCIGGRGSGANLSLFDVGDGIENLGSRGGKIGNCSWRSGGGAGGEGTVGAGAPYAGSKLSFNTFLAGKGGGNGANP